MGMVKRAAVGVCLFIYLHFYFFSSTFFIILFYFLTLQYCIGFAIYQHESTTSIQMLHQFAFPPTVQKFPFFPHPCQHLLFLVFLIIAILRQI